MRSKVSQQFLQVILLTVVVCLDVMLEPITILSQEKQSNPISWNDLDELESLGDEMMLMQISSSEDLNSKEAHCLDSGNLFRRLLHCRTGSEVCARRTTLWTVALFGFAFLQSGVKDVMLLSI